MASRLNPYLSFKGDARAAMEFYQRVFGGELVVNTFGDFQNPDPALADQVMHSQLETSLGFTLMASDSPPHFEWQPGNNISISLSGDDGDDLRTYFAQLAEGGTVMTPLAVQMWGDEFGMLTDRFGINWLVNIGKAA